MPRSTRSGSPGGSIDRGAHGYECGVQSLRTDTDEGVVEGPVDEETQTDLAGRVGELAREQDLKLAVAESLTGGMIAAKLAAAEQSSEWFLGGVVAYASEVKHAVLDVPEGPVVNAPAATAMAQGVRRLLGADAAVAVTGAAGPSGQDGREPGTVYVAFDGGEEHRVLHLQLDEEPSTVCAMTTVAALRLLIECLEASAS
jgi:nicotinamide-nucleotide amidase